MNDGCCTGAGLAAAAAAAVDVDSRDVLFAEILILKPRSIIGSFC